MWGRNREYWMIYKGLGYLAVVWVGSSPTPSPLSRQQAVYLSQSSCVSPVALTDRIGGKGGGTNQIIRPRESRPSINHSILSGKEPVPTTAKTFWSSSLFLFYRSCSWKSFNSLLQPYIALSRSNYSSTTFALLSRFSDGRARRKDGG